MAEFFVDVGDSARFSKTVGESDVYQFAGITGDFAPNHVNNAFMQQSAYGERIAHGALLVGYMSTAASLTVGHTPASADEVAISLGYDRIRFIAPVYFGDTVTVAHVISAIDPDRRRANADVTVTNQDGTVVAVATHVLKWVKKS
ncbi:MAG: dehydratase [Proteobacteria bacterium]|nr:dehydratase [Pseudomonadota bacterium]